MVEIQEAPNSAAGGPRVVARNSLREEVRQEIVRLIVNGHLTPGESINERNLASQLGVSRTPVREALLGLERDGMVRADAPRGFSIEPLTAEEVRQTYPMLGALEALAVRSTPDFAASLLEELEALNEEMRERGGDDPHLAIEYDNRWHRLLVSRSGNRRLIELLETLKRAVRRYEYAYMTTEGLTKASIGQHQAIIDALRAGDRESAIEWLKRNFQISLDYFLESLGTGSPSAEAQRGSSESRTD